MHELLAWLEQSGLGHAMRESGVWSYGLVNLAHILGVSTLFGSVLVLDLRLLGAWHTLSLAALSTPVVPISAAGFAIAVSSGVCLIATNGTEYVGNPFLYVKFPAILVGGLNVAVLNLMPAWRQRHRREANRSERYRLALVGGVSLLSWLTAVAAGRMIGYW